MATEEIGARIEDGDGKNDRDAGNGDEDGSAADEEGGE